MRTMTGFYVVPIPVPPILDIYFDSVDPQSGNTWSPL
jgi:hypothetical protein